MEGLEVNTMNNRASLLVLVWFMMSIFCSVGSAQDIREVVHATYIAGVPYETATQFDSDDCNYLLNLIEREDEAPYWPNATKVLGIIGGEERAYQPLVDLVEGHKDDFPNTSAVYRGRLSALFALGYLANHDHAGSERALKYIQKSMKPSDWRRRGLKWIKKDDAVNLSISAVHALAISGRDEVPGILTELLKSGVPDRTKHAAKSALVSLGR